MRKLTGIVCLLALMLTLTACAGAGDWKYEDLPGDYAVWRINSQEIPLVCVDDDGLTAEPVVEGYVYAVAWDESTIYVQQRAEKDKGDMAYYAVALDSGAVSGPYTETEFAAACAEQGVDAGGSYLHRQEYPRRRIPEQLVSERRIKIQNWWNGDVSLPIQGHVRNLLPRCF